ncbi:MAG TPA: YihY/virulence factor BrkB family protein [Burkholderiales bacterium]|nr:YihY/virulence factor BrkB family protein [Burkholderiales bacterium]
MQSTHNGPTLILKRPGRFVLQVLQAFRANQGFLLAGAVAYYTLLSVVPLFTLLLIFLSHFFEQTLLMATLARYLSFVMPGETASMLEEISELVKHREVVGWVLVAVLLFFSSMAFTILENAMSVIFVHRVVVRRRHFLISALLPYLYIVLLGIGLLATTLIAGALQTIEVDRIGFLGREISVDRISVAVLYLIGLLGEVFMLTAIYLVMPVGRLSVRHALIGGVTAALLWELTRRALVWYFGTLSLVNVVYGSLATAIVALLTLEVAAMILLLGAQVIAEYERLLRKGDFSDPKAMWT